MSIRPRHLRSRRRAFTIAELLIALTIMVLMALLVVPALVGMDRRQARHGVEAVADLLTMYAYRDATGNQMVALWGSASSGELGLWILDVEPDDPDELPVWLPDRFSPPIVLPEVLELIDVRVDGRRLDVRDFLVARQPNEPRPLVEIDLWGADQMVTLVLEPHATSPRRVVDRVSIEGWREPIDLDRIGRDREDW